MGGTTGVSLKQGSGPTDLSRGRPGRRPENERPPLALVEISRGCHGRVSFVSHWLSPTHHGATLKTQSSFGVGLV